MIQKTRAQTRIQRASSASRDVIMPRDERRDARLSALGARLFAASDKVPSELFALTHGAFVRQILRDREEDVDAANAALERVGRSLGARAVEEYLARASIGRESLCGSFEEACEATARSAMKMFLGVDARTRDWSEEGDECVIEMDGNPLAEFVEIPERYDGLCYCNILCGAIRGALEAVRVRTHCSFEGDPLAGRGEKFAIRVKLLEIVPEEYPFDD